MKPLPLPVRLAAGLAVTAVEQARKLPQQLAGLPVTVVSEALQLSMRVQQTVTELAIKGDDALSVLRPVDDEPEWATFDEDEPDDPAGDLHGPDDLDGPDDDGDPWAQEERALAAEPPAALPDYDALTLPQLRAKLRSLTAEELEQLLAHERTHAARPEFTGMLTRRLANLKDR
ncbi:lipid droplet-associated protein [Saccharothrix longispora]|uniref:lipid droplet-associated protein n=1 Tax=Saccharothrix longispora TaxID=33920 RepID=UPI0028FD5300|nr:lipid droplet-associated protein [Saccharothrix longispora]MBY8848275.1 lipid droplet-associated protein [Saccharothrix sp. MB29]MDU0291984.1 lipid droplet-associated protein [Saccharothrix longispora]